MCKENQRQINEIMVKKNVILFIAANICLKAAFDLTSIGAGLLSVFGNQENPSIAEDARLTAPQLIEKYGYNAEIHHVTTDDGYILELHRIAGGPKSPPRKGKKVCFLMHGFTFSSAPFVIPGSTALGYRLADEDLDVWMGNCRGNIYSRSHTTYDVNGSPEDQQKFWSFSLDEIGYYDVPASIDYVLNATGETKMHYLGHSQGSTTFFIMASEKPEYMDKIEIFHAVNPAVYMSHLKSPLISFVARHSDTLDRFTTFFGFNQIDLPQVQQICQTNLAQRLCNFVLLTSVMGETDQTNTTLLPIIFSHTPAGAAVKQFAHFVQFMNSGRFRKFDYGTSENLVRYGQPSPPDYDLQKATIPTAVYYAKGDWLITVEDVRLLIKELPNVVKDYLIPHEKFNHIDMLWAYDADRLVYDEIVKNMKSTQNDFKSSQEET